MITHNNTSYYPQSHLNVDNAGIETKVLYMALVDRINPIHSSDNYNLRQGGSLETVAEMVNVWHKMGITDLWLNPIMENREGPFYNARGDLIESYFGYWPIKPFNIDPKIGGEAGFQTLLKTLDHHAMGIILDIPFKSFGPCLVNEYYADTSNPYQGILTIYDQEGAIFTQWPDDVAGGQHLFTGNGPIEGDFEWNNPDCLMYKDITPGCPSLNLDDDRVVSFIAQYTNHLIHKVIEYSTPNLGITLRLDAANHLIHRNGYGELVFGKLWHKFVHLIKHNSTYARKLFLFQEHYGATLEEETYPLWKELPYLVNATGVSLYDFGFHENLKTAFTHQKTDKSYGDIINLKDYIIKRESYGFDYPLKEKQILFINSHDEPRFMDKVIETRGWNEEEARKALEAAYTILLTSRGVPMIFYGDDIYLHAQDHQYGYIGHHPIRGGDPYNRGNYYRESQQQNPAGYNHMSWIICQLARLRNIQHQGILYGETIEKWVSHHAFAYTRHHNNDHLFVLANSAPHKEHIGTIQHTGLPQGDYINLVAEYGDTRTYSINETGTLHIFDAYKNQLYDVDRFDHIVLGTLQGAGLTLFTFPD